MSASMGDFQRLMEMSAGGEMNELGRRYEGFFRFAKLLEEIARGLADGRIPRPRGVDSPAAPGGTPAAGRHQQQRRTQPRAASRPVPAFEKPVTPTHCLQILNATMRTDILRTVHEAMHVRKAQPQPASPLHMLIGSIADTLEVWGSGEFLPLVGPNPLNPAHYPFDREQDYHHDIALLTCQLQALQEILADIEKWR